MAFGLPIITPSWRSVPERLPKDDSGIVEIRSPRKIAEKLIDFAEGKSCIDELHQRFTQSFTTGQHIGKLAKAIGGAYVAKPKLLVLELWGLGDLAIATTFLRAACEKYDVTLLAKTYAVEMQPHFWPEVKVIPFNAPWTRFRNKYNLLKWNWTELGQALEKVREQNFDFAVSARWDPRDHLLMDFLRAKQRVGFPRAFSQIFLTKPLPQPSNETHRYECWRALGDSIGIRLPPRHQNGTAETKPIRSILLHSGAAQAVRVWPLERAHGIAQRLRAAGCKVQIACDPNQLSWWNEHGEEAVSPTNVNQLMELLEGSDLFFGNDSGPGHVAAAAGVPTFTIFGPQLPGLFLPVHPMAGFVEGKPCPYKPCSDYCRYPTPHCILTLGEAEVWVRLQRYMIRHEHNAAGVVA
ncbi:MAG: glycosyltransferase family 9 protein [Verrucomicrobiota bacterium]